jgi:hypothetical protein
MSKELKKKEVVEISEPSLVRVFSTRKGPIILPCGKVLNHGDVLMVDCETAIWLENSFKGFVKKID